MLNRFLEESPYIDCSAPILQAELPRLFAPGMTAVEKARAAYTFVRDEIPHSFDCEAAAVTARASDVLRCRTGICYAKSNLLAALLRTQGIPAGLCYQRLTLLDDDSAGYCLHAYNAVFLEGRWVRLDARGNKPGVCAQFSLGEPALAFPVRPEYGELLYPGIYAAPYPPTMAALERAASIRQVWEDLPDRLDAAPDLPL